MLSSSPLPGAGGYQILTGDPHFRDIGDAVPWSTVTWGVGTLRLYLDLTKIRENDLYEKNYQIFSISNSFEVKTMAKGKMRQGKSVMPPLPDIDDRYAKPMGMKKEKAKKRE